MNKLLKSVNFSSSKKHDEVIKKSITTNLSTTVKEIQYACIQENGSQKENNIIEASNQLCTVIEAMFLHGLRDSLKLRFKKALADVDTKPELPNFWAPLLIISHRQIIDQITDLTQINSEVGQCRAWIRLALNDSLLSSYLMTIRQDTSALKSYYNTSACIRDTDFLEVAQKFIEGVETCKGFSLPSNSSLLNNWQLQSLILAGIWSPTLKNTPLAACEDVAMTLDKDIGSAEEASDTASLCSATSFSSQYSGLRQVTSLSEEEVLKIITTKDKVGSSDNIDIPNYSPQTISDVNGSADRFNHNIGNSVSGNGWSFDEAEESAVKDDNVTVLPISDDMMKSMEGSFTTLVESYNVVGGNYIRTPEIKGLWHKTDNKIPEHNESTISTSSPSELHLETSISLPSPSSTRSESKFLASLVLTIAIEKGLDVQNFECAGCQSAFNGLTYLVCYYTGDYFCADCMSEEEMRIPARMVHNWDFKMYPVSKKSFKYVNDIKDHPVIDFKVVNPYIYEACDEMNQIQVLRTQLNFLRAYLYTCREPIIQELQQQMWPREYMYEHIHQFSISDLDEVRNNTLAQQLEKVVKFGINHVLNCWVCSGKGFLCEVCVSFTAIYPFDVANVSRCEICGAVYHKQCLSLSKPCRKCERRKKREELPLLDAVRLE